MMKSTQRSSGTMLATMRTVTASQQVHLIQASTHSRQKLQVMKERSKKSLLASMAHRLLPRRLCQDKCQVSTVHRRRRLHLRRQECFSRIFKWSHSTSTTYARDSWFCWHAASAAPTAWQDLWPLLSTAGIQCGSYDRFTCCSTEEETQGAALGES